jgi:hypothetical protein
MGIGFVVVIGFIAAIYTILAKTAQDGGVPDSQDE